MTKPIEDVLDFNGWAVPKGPREMVVSITHKCPCCDEWVELLVCVDDDGVVTPDASLSITVRESMPKPPLSDGG